MGAQEKDELQAIDDLTKVFKSGRATQISGRTCEVLCQCLQTGNSKWRLHLKVVWLLAEFAEKGNEEIIRSVAARVNSEHFPVTIAASKALGRIANIGNEHAISALASVLP